MSLITEKGILEKKSNGTVFNGAWTKYEFLIINGKRYRNVRVSNFLDNFLNIGDEIAVAIIKDGWFGTSQYLAALRDSDGNVEWDEGTKRLYIYMAFSFAILMIIPAAVVGLALQSVGVGWSTYIAGIFGFPYLLIKNRLKARRVLLEQ